MKGLGNLGYKTGTIEIANIEAIEVVLEYLRTPANVALMCVCVSPTQCHRWRLVQAALDREASLKVIHLSRDGLPIRHIRLDQETMTASLGL
jgi:hypothetical protein